MKACKEFSGEPQLDTEVEPEIQGQDKKIK